MTEGSSAMAMQPPSTACRSIRRYEGTKVRRSRVVITITQFCQAGPFSDIRVVSSGVGTWLALITSDLARLTGLVMGVGSCSWAEETRDALVIALRRMNRLIICSF
jgi:hypothetical protein